LIRIQFKEIPQGFEGYIVIKTLNQHGFYQKDIAAELEIHPKNRQSVAEVGWPAESDAES
jgi:hypothetical protein